MQCSLLLQHANRYASLGKADYHDGHDCIGRRPQLQAFQSLCNRGAKHLAVLHFYHTNKLLITGMHITTTTDAQD